MPVRWNPVFTFSEIPQPTIKSSDGQKKNSHFTLTLGILGNFNFRHFFGLFLDIFSVSAYPLPQMSPPRLQPLAAKGRRFESERQKGF